MDCNGSNARQVTFTGASAATLRSGQPNGKRFCTLRTNHPLVHRLGVLNSNGSDQMVVDISFAPGSPGFWICLDVSWAPRDDFFVISDSRFIATAKLDGNKAVNVKVFAFPPRRRIGSGVSLSRKRKGRAANLSEFSLRPPIAIIVAKNESAFPVPLLLRFRLPFAHPFGRASWRAFLFSFPEGGFI